MDSKRSHKKQKFFEHHIDTDQKVVEPYQFSPANLPKLAAHYEEKYQIRIVTCGQTRFGKDLIEDMKKAIALIDSELKYVRYFKEFSLRNTRQMKFFETHHFRDAEDSIFYKEEEKLHAELKPFLHHQKNGYVIDRFVKYLTTAKAREFDKFCEEKLFCKEKLKAAVTEYFSVKYVHGICQFQNQFNSKELPAAHLYSTVEKTLSPFVSTFHSKSRFIPYKLKWELSLDELKQFDKVCEEFPNTLKSALDEKIKQHHEKKLNEEIANCMLSTEQALKEAESIQEGMKDSKDVAGYMWMPQAVNQDHTEILIITPTQIINPVCFLHDAPRVLLRAPYLYVPHVKPFVEVIEGTPYISSEFPYSPQAGNYECGTLGILYLKELLKDKAEQLREYTLRFSFYHNGSLKNFFLPSPQVLRFSQVSTYNNILEAMLEQKDFVIVEASENRKLKIKTIKKMLEETLENAKSKNEEKLIEQTTSLLSALPTFSEKWLKAYKIASQQRDNMQLKYDLVEMKSQKESKGNVIQFACEENGLRYQVINESGSIKKGFIEWSWLPRQFPRDAEEILKNKQILLPIILDQTRRANHTRHTHNIYLLYSSTRMKKLTEVKENKDSKDTKSSILTRDKPSPKNFI